MGLWETCESTRMYTHAPSLASTCMLTTTDSCVAILEGTLLVLLAAVGAGLAYRPLPLVPAVSLEAWPMRPGRRAVARRRRFVPVDLVVVHFGLA